jgi:hypothetical protein
MKNEKDNQPEESKVPLIDRKQAIKKAGFIALSAATMMMLLSKPENAQAASAPAPPPIW